MAEQNAQGSQLHRRGDAIGQTELIALSEEWHVAL
jgi:hypothetical protein